MLASVIVVIVPIGVSVIPVCVVISLSERTQETFPRIMTQIIQHQWQPYCHSNFRNENSIRPKVWVYSQGLNPLFRVGICEVLHTGDSCSL